MTISDRQPLPLINNEIGQENDYREVQNEQTTPGIDNSIRRNNSSEPRVWVTMGNNNNENIKTYLDSNCLMSMNLGFK